MFYFIFIILFEKIRLARQMIHMKFQVLSFSEKKKNQQ